MKCPYNHLTAAKDACSEPAQDRICQQQLMDAGGSHEVHFSLLKSWLLMDSPGWNSLSSNEYPLENQQHMIVLYLWLLRCPRLNSECHKRK